MPISLMPTTLAGALNNTHSEADRRPQVGPRPAFASYLGCHGCMTGQEVEAWRPQAQGRQGLTHLNISLLSMVASQKLYALA